MCTEVVVCSPHDSLHRAAQLMWDHNVGWLPVCGDHHRRVAGVITDRDICMAAFLQRQTLMDIRVADVMTTQVESCNPPDSLDEAGRRMCARQVRRLPVLDERGALVGMISLADLAREALREQTLQSRQITGHEVCTTLASICRRPDR